MDCFFCNPTPEFEKYRIAEFNNWRIELHSNQAYLGRCIIVLKNHAEDLFDLNEEKIKELFEVGKNLRNALNKSFKPDLFNYSSLGNEVRHLHLHVVPRYETVRKLAGITFADERKGKNYSPYNKDFQISDDAVEEIIKTIKYNLEL